MRLIFLLLFALIVMGSCPDPVAALAGDQALEKSLVIGVSELEPPLGRIVRAALAPDGSLYVVDVQSSEVRHYSADGQWLGVLGEVGEGPGEYTSPEVVAVDPEGRVYVAGNSLSIEVFSADGSPLDRIHRIRTGPVKALVIGQDGTLYTSSFDIQSETMIHRYSIETGEHLNSFGESFAATLGRDRVDVRSEVSLASGALAMWGSNIVYAQSWPQELRVYTPEGELLDVFAARRDEAGEYPEPEINGDSIHMRFPDTFGMGVAVAGDIAWTGFYTQFGGNFVSYLDAWDLRTGDKIMTTEVDPFGFVVHAADREGPWGSELVGEIPAIVKYRIAASP